jgi:hypothetical protein
MNPILRHTSFLVVLASASLAHSSLLLDPRLHLKLPPAIPANMTPTVPRISRAGHTVPATVSPQAQQKLSRSAPDQGPPETLALRRSKLDALALRDAE